MRASHHRSNKVSRCVRTDAHGVTSRFPTQGRSQAGIPDVSGRDVAGTVRGLPGAISALPSLLGSAAITPPALPSYIDMSPLYPSIQRSAASAESPVEDAERASHHPVRSGAFSVSSGSNLPKRL